MVDVNSNDGKKRSTFFLSFFFDIFINKTTESKMKMMMIYKMKILGDSCSICIIVEYHREE